MRKEVATGDVVFDDIQDHPDECCPRDFTHM
jgi:hypothetical protein